MSQPLRPARPLPDYGPVFITTDVKEERTEIAGANSGKAQVSKKSFELRRPENPMFCCERRCEALPDFSLQALKIGNNQRQPASRPHQAQVLNDGGACIFKMFDQAG